MTRTLFAGTIVSVHSHPGAYMLTMALTRPAAREAIITVHDPEAGLDQDLLAEALHLAVTGTDDRSDIVGRTIEASCVVENDLILARPADIARA